MLKRCARPVWDDEAIYFAITTSALFNFYNRWITAAGVPEMSAEVTAQGKMLAEQGYIREEKSKHAAYRLARRIAGNWGPMAFRPETAKPINDLVNVLLHEPHSLSPGENELIATYVSAGKMTATFARQIRGAIEGHDLGGDSELVHTR